MKGTSQVHRLWWRSSILVGLLFCFLSFKRNDLVAQEFSTEPILLQPDVDLKYLKDAYFMAPTRGKTNWVHVYGLGLNYGDVVRIRTRGSYSVRLPGDADFGPEEPQPFLGFFTGVVLKPSLYHAAPLFVSGLPEFVTPSIKDANGNDVPTDVAKDFLITPEGVSLCLPVEGNFLGMLNSDPRASAVDTGDDFRIEINPIEGARVRSGVALTATEVTVGDSVGLTLSLTNRGNAAAFSLEMDDSRNEWGIERDPKLIVGVSGPTPVSIPSLSPGEQGKFSFSFRTVGPGTNIFRVRAGSVFCGSTFYAAYGGFATLIIKPIVDVTPVHPSEEIYAEKSIEAGRTDIDLPLRYVESEQTLRKAELFPGAQWVADGVTPLLLRLEIAPDKLEHYANGATLEIKVGQLYGEIAGTPIQDRMEVLQDSVWTPNGRAKISKEKPYAFVMLNAIKADELKMLAGWTEVMIKADVIDQTGLTVGALALSIRRPPIVLLHGYNTQGDWDAKFVNELTKVRGDLFAKIARYGQSFERGPISKKPILENTLQPFDDLVQPASIAVDQALDATRNRWIFTRHDIVGHSQGGLLARMLCAEKWSGSLFTSFRDKENFNRGRFHRVVTIGAPFNGTRLLHYVRALSKNTNELVSPTYISHQIMRSDKAQEKFDPWGEQVARVNNPDGAFAPDPGAKFHMVGTLILNGQSFSTKEGHPLWALGLDTPERGAIVLDEGSDGVVDYASMFGKEPGAPLPENAYLVPAASQIAHAGAVGFGVPTSQTDSAVVAQHVIQALDQYPSIPASERVFSSIILPKPLPTSIRDAIDQLAASFEKTVSSTTASTNTSTGASVGDLHAASSVRDFTVRINQPPARPISGKIYWIPQIYGSDGVTVSGVQVRPAGADRSVVTLRVNSGVYGDLVFEGVYESTDNTRVVVRPYLVASLVPPGTTATGFVVIPGEGARYPSGLEIPIEIWTTWSDGSESQRFLNAQNVQATSSRPEVVDVSNPLKWRTGVPGETSITTSFQGKMSTMKWTVYAQGTAEPSRPRLTIGTASRPKLSWPTSSEKWQLQSTDHLGAEANWQPATESAAQVANEFVVQVGGGAKARFYRLQALP